MCISKQALPTPQPSTNITNTIYAIPLDTDGLRRGRSVTISVPKNIPRNKIHRCQFNCGIFSHHNHCTQSI